MLGRRLKTFLLIVGFLIIVIGGAWLIRTFLTPGEVFIYNVPYTGIYNSDFSQSSAAAAVYSVLRYWHQYDNSLPNPTLADIQNRFPVGIGVMLPSPHEIASYFQGLGYDTKIIRTERLRRLARYLGPTSQTPLIFSQSPSPDFKGNNRPYRVLLGVSFREKTMVVHDMYFGPAYRMSLTEWRKSYAQDLPENMKYVFLIARPPDYKRLLSQATLSDQSYPSREQYDRYKIVLLRLLEAIDNSVSFGEARFERLKIVESDPYFSELSPAIRVNILASMAGDMNRMGQPKQAEELAKRALSINVNLDKPWGIWSGFPQSESPRPWAHLGRAYHLLGEYDSAMSAYRKALAIDPNYPRVQELLDSIEMR